MHLTLEFHDVISLVAMAESSKDISFIARTSMMVVDVQSWLIIVVDNKQGQIIIIDI